MLKDLKEINQRLEIINNLLPTFNTEERKENVDFTDSYAQGIQVVIVPEGSDIKTVDDLSNDKMIGTQEATTGYIYCSDTVENGGYGEDHVIAYTNGATAIQALLAGKVDAVVIDNNPAKAFVAANEGLAVKSATSIVKIIFFIFSPFPFNNENIVPWKSLKKSL